MQKPHDRKTDNKKWRGTDKVPETGSKSERLKTAKHKKNWKHSTQYGEREAPAVEREGPE
ncbi:hypothetical protein ZHAS_00006241 [Anopheles sinensis]|uniref:Uncharacterized protein n=1 Tax=Anopheles sinensis TaxID=74873 RepID=A0A084VLS6_ANOSI|nr:hypothetical protein ZHAS_00006241 [Anopheles sinensis]